MMALSAVARASLRTAVAHPGAFREIRDILDFMDAPGSKFYVDSATGADASGRGTTPELPVATIDYAYNLCTANKGDKIYVLPGHSETISGATSLVCDKAGVTIVGLGSGSLKPKLDFSAAASAIPVSAANNTFENLQFEASFADIVRAFNITAKHCRIIDCDFLEPTANENWLDVIDASSTTNNNADGLYVEGCRYHGADTANSNFIEVNADLDRLVMKDCYIVMGVQDSHAVIGVATGKDLTNVYVNNNDIYRLNTAGDLLCDSDTTANTGIFSNNRFAHADTAAEILIDCDGAYCFNNYASGVTTASGYLLPAADS